MNGMSLPPLVPPAAELTRDEVARYGRHLVLPGIGSDGQRRLKNARVLVVGAGGLGSPVLLYLAAAGVGTLGIVEFDVVEESNLQRQIIHGTSDIGRPKAHSARDSIAAISVGIVDGQPVLDLPYVEDSRADVDMNVVMTGADGLVEVQGTAEGTPFPRADLNSLLDLAGIGMISLRAAQQAAINAA